MMRNRAAQLSLGNSLHSDLLIQFLTLRKLCSFVRSNRRRKPIASRKNAVVKLRNLKTKCIHNRYEGFRKFFRGQVWKGVHVPLLPCSVPQLQVDLLSFTWCSTRGRKQLWETKTHDDKWLTKIQNVKVIGKKYGTEQYKHKGTIMF